MVLIKGLLIFFLCTTSLVHAQKDDWWKSATIYQIAPLSFKDTTGDGKGDIQGIISKLDYLADTGIDVLLISPFFQSQMVDFAYDISNYIEVDSIFGTMKDVEELFTKAKAKGLKVILDFVPNHTSNKHEWFIKSEVGTDGYKDFYIWHDGAKQINEGRNLPPNSWQSEYGGSSWTWSPMREAYYYHKFAKEQPDLNLGEELVVQKLNEVLKFWLDKGCDGFRLDASSQLFEDPAFLDKPDKEKDLPQTYALIERWRKFLDDYSKTESKILIPQVWNSPIEDLMRYYVSEDGTPRAQVPMNFMLINELNINSTASDYKRVIEKYLSSLPTGAIANWFLGSHDHNRVASRMGRDRIDGLMILLQTLPGISFTYYGDEIGMEDHTDISWEDTKDIQACNADEDSYQPLSRDVARTPFQWDKTENSGFTSGKSWLPVHPGYVENNLESQMSVNKSHYKLFKELTSLRKNATLALGDIDFKVLGDNVLAYSRTYEKVSYLIAINLGNKTENVDASGFKVNLKEESKILLASPNSKHEINETVSLKNLNLTPYDAIIIDYYSSATKVTLSLLAVMMIIVKIFI